MTKFNPKSISDFSYCYVYSDTSCVARTSQPTPRSTMPPVNGSCYCTSLAFTLTLTDPAEDARTSLCHCGNCKKFTGGPFGVTTKVSRSSFKYTKGAGGEGTNCEDARDGKGAEARGDGGEKVVIKVHEADNGGGVVIRREFCGVCGGPILEYGVSSASLSPSDST
jgi:hypothetical protein